MSDDGDSNKDPYVRMDPSPAKTIACFYCGGGVPWFQCHCFRAVEAQTGKRPKPRFIPAEQSPNGRPIIVLDEEALANGWLKLPRLVTPVPESEGGVTPTDHFVTPDVTKLAIVTGDVTKSPPAVTEVVTKLPLTAAERQAAKRARDRAAKTGEEV